MSRLATGTDGFIGSGWHPISASGAGFLVPLGVGSGSCEEAEGVTRWVEQDPDVVLWLMVCDRRAERHREDHPGVEIVDHDVQVCLHLLVAGVSWPHWRTVPCLLLERQAGPTARRSQRHPVRLVVDDLSVEQLAIEGGELSGVGRPEHRGRQAGRRSLSHGHTVPDDRRRI